MQPIIKQFVIWMSSGYSLVYEAERTKLAGHEKHASRQTRAAACGMHSMRRNTRKITAIRVWQCLGVAGRWNFSALWLDSFPKFNLQRVCHFSSCRPLSRILSPPALLQHHITVRRHPCCGSPLFWLFSPSQICLITHQLHGHAQSFF